MLDVLTPNGKTSVQHERRAIALFESAHPGMSLIHTARDKPVSHDGVVVQNKEVIGIFEIKTRSMSLAKFEGELKGWALLTGSKLDRAAMTSTEWQVPFWLLFYLIEDGCLIAKPITDDTGRLTAKVKRSEFETQATVNGGTAVRDNALIFMGDAYLIGKNTDYDW